MLVPLGLADLAGLSDVIPVGIGCFPVRRMSKHQALSSLGGGEGEASAVLGVLYARNSSVWAPHALWRRSGRRVVPSAEVAQDLLHHPRVVNDGKDPHRVLADRAA